MPKDAPDFSVGTTDLLPSIVNTMPILRNYPGGSVFYFDNFEGPNITWDIDKADGASYCFAEIDKTHAYLGTGCARLYRNENQEVAIRLDRRFQFRSSDTIGVEFSFMFSDIGYANTDFVYEYKIGGTRYRFFINSDGHSIRVHTSEGNYYLGYSSSNGLWNMTWNNVKVVLNIKDHRYVRLYYGKEVFNMDYPPQTFSEAGDEAPRLRLGFYSSVFGDAQKSMWIDKVILTDDETI